MKVFSDISLTKYNSFGISAKAKKVFLIEKESDLEALSEYQLGSPLLILGEGTNTLFSRDFEGSIVKMGIKGIAFGENKDGFQEVRVGGGENWHDLVLETLQHGLRGLENLSLIPGSVGAAPIQNIGAYGVEVCDFIESVEGFDLMAQRTKVLSRDECGFEYRTSIFKKDLRDRFLVTHVNFLLEREWTSLNTSYRSLRSYLDEHGIIDPDPVQLSNAVIDIRNSKLPDPKLIGNAGSFFKNPVIEPEEFISLKSRYPDVAGFEQQDGRVKVFAGWLIENLGWKGKKLGNAGVHKDQALVIVNLGNAKGEEVKMLAQKLIDEVHEVYGLELEPEVRII